MKEYQNQVSMSLSKFVNKKTKIALFKKIMFLTILNEILMGVNLKRKFKFWLFQKVRKKSLQIRS